MVKRLLITGVFIFGLVVQAQAGASGFFGISYIFGTSPGDFGVTVKLLSDDDENTGVVGGGVSYYPFAEVKKFGADLGVGYLFKNGAVTAGWDFLQKKPQIAIGYVDTEDDKTTPAAPTEPTPPPSEGSET